jgi:hypothetical protein
MTFDLPQYNSQSCGNETTINFEVENFKKSLGKKLNIFM